MVELPIWSLAAVILGWVLNEASQLFRTRREDRRPIRTALSELLEIRHHIFGIERVFSGLQRTLNISDAELLRVRPLLRQALPDLRTVRERYLGAVSQLAGIDPYLAFQLRNKDLIGALDTLAPAIGITKDQMPFWAAVEKRTINQLLPMLDASIRRLAWRCGVLTYLKVSRYLAKPVITDEGFQEFFDSLLAAVSEASDSVEEPKQANAVQPVEGRTGDNCV